MNADAILSSATAIANQWRGLAVAWHVGFIILIVLAAARLVSRRSLAVALALPVWSVATIAAIAGNPFNAAVFMIAGAVLLWIASRIAAAPIELSAWPVLTGAALILTFGLVYPHFLGASSWTDYLYQAPLGLLPCPTLTAIAGVTLMVRSLSSSLWSRAIALMALFYGIVGVFVLHVFIDAVLIVAALLLLVSVGGEPAHHADSRSRRRAAGPMPV